MIALLLAGHYASERFGVENPLQPLDEQSRVLTAFMNQDGGPAAARPHDFSVPAVSLSLKITNP